MAVATNISGHDQMARVLFALSRQDLVPIAQSLYCLLTSVFPTKVELTHPGADALADLLHCSRQSLWVAEKALAACGAITFAAPYQPCQPRRFTLHKLPLPPDQEQRCVDLLAQVKVAFESVVPLVKPARGRRTPASPADLERVRLATSNLAMMLAYLLFGKDALTPEVAAMPAVSREDCARICAVVGGLQLPPAQTNWRTVSPPPPIQNPKASDLAPSWSVPQWAAYYWYCVSGARQRNGMGLSLPNWGKLARTFKTLLTQWPPEALYGRVRDATVDFEIVRASLRDGISGTLSLDETTLLNPIVKGVLDNLPDFDSPERRELRGRALQGERLNLAEASRQDNG